MRTVFCLAVAVALAAGLLISRSAHAQDCCADPTVTVAGPSGKPPVAGSDEADATMWPPNHKLRNVTLTAGEGCTISVMEIMQDEPLDDIGDGATSPDATGCESGECGDTEEVTVQLRAERAGPLTGRYYHVMWEQCGDGCMEMGESVILVRHDQGMANVSHDECETMMMCFPSCEMPM